MACSMPVPVNAFQAFLKKLSFFLVSSGLNLDVDTLLFVVNVVDFFSEGANCSYYISDLYFTSLLEAT